MPHFLYRGRDVNGKDIVGEMSSANTEDVAKSLISRGIMPIDISERSEKKKAPSQLESFMAKHQVPLTEIIMFSRQMFSLLKAGVPLVKAISGLSETTTCQPLSAALKEVVVGIESGQTLATAMQAHQHIFSPLYLSMVHVGENTGRLDLAFQQTAIYLENDYETRKRVKQAVRYPITVIGFVTIAIVVINIFVIPKFATMFAGLNTELPLATQILIASSNFFLNQWKLLLFMLALSIILFFHWKNTDQGAFNWDRHRLKFPLIGPILYQATLARFARTFAILLKGGVPLIHSLNVVSRVVDNIYIGTRIREMVSGIERGEPLTRNARASGLFSPLILQMLAVGEESGTIDELLLEVADYYEREVDYKIKKLAEAIEPILLVCVGVMVLILALGVFLPMWEMSNISR